MGQKVFFDMDVRNVMMRHHMDDTGRLMLASEVKRLCDPYVPMDTGTLKNTAIVQKDGVLYRQPYAAVQYYTNSGRSGGHRGKEWDKRMLADKKDELLQTMSKLLGGD